MVITIPECNALGRFSIHMTCLLFLVMMIAGCQQTSAKPLDNPFATPYQVGQVTSQSVQGCNIEAKTIWHDTAQGRYHLESRSMGNNCREAELSLAVRMPTGRVIMRKNFRASDIANFQEATNPRSMRSALIAWMTENGRVRTTAGLPDWVEAQYSRLQLSPQMKRGLYISLRRQAVPMLCFYNSLRTKACFALHEEERELIKIGTVQFKQAR